MKQTISGNDKIKGRPLKLNVFDLTPKPNKDYAELLFFGDLHLGHPNCKLTEAKAMLDWALKNKCKVLLMGDLLETSLRDSIGDTVYHQVLNPQEQMDEMIDILTPLAEANLIVGLHEGNHENRVAKNTAINPSKIMARTLGVRYMGYAGPSLIRVGKQNYFMYSTHGSSGSKFKHTKMKAVGDMLYWLDGIDIVAMGHVHSLAAEPVTRKKVDLRNKQWVDVKAYTVLTGSYVGWEDSYAEMKGMPPSKIGSPKAMFQVDRHDIHFSV